MTDEEYLNSKRNLENDIKIGKAYTKLSKLEEFNILFNTYFLQELPISTTKKYLDNSINKESLDETLEAIKYLRKALTSLAYLEETAESSLSELRTYYNNKAIND